MTKKSDPITKLEEQHGFTFGGTADSAGAEPTLSLTCPNLTCPNRARRIQLHADTVLPVTCGGCGQVLHCDHVDTLPITTHEGTLAAPVRVKKEVCIVCLTELSRHETPLAPIPFDQIPLHLLGTNVDTIVKGMK
jgi:hypothetical protein